MNGSHNIGVKAGILCLGASQAGVGVLVAEQLSSVQYQWAGIRTPYGPKTLSAP